MIAPETIVGFDIGTSKICAVVARTLSSDGDLEIATIEKVPSQGIRKGVIVDPDRTCLGIRECKTRAEQIAGGEIDSAFVSVSGAYFQAHHAEAMVGVAEPQKGISQEDIERARDLAQRTEIPRGHRLIDVRIREYVVDGQVGVTDPLGMNGMRLEVKALLITAAIPQIELVYRTLDNAGIDVEDLILQPIAAAEAVLTPKEKETGVALVDIGGGTTDLVVYQNGNIAHVAIFPVGGDHIDSDISCGLGILKPQGERMKIQVGGVGKEHLNSIDLVELTREGNRSGIVGVKIIAEIIYPRVEEIFTLVGKELVRTNLLNSIPSGFVITGGTALLPGLTDMVTELFQLPARVGNPLPVDGLTEELRNPIYASAIGLAKLGYMEYWEKHPVSTSSPFTNILTSASGWTRNTTKSIMKFLFR